MRFLIRNKVMGLAAIVASSGSYFGYRIFSIDGESWYWYDTKEFIGVSGKLRCNRPCKECGLSQGSNGHDPCISNLPGVEYACCGHGLDDGYPYIKKYNGNSVNFDTFKEMKAWLKENLDYDTKE